MRKSRKETTTGGREATTRHLPGDAVLSICQPTDMPKPHGWRWVALEDVAKMESGHTPSRRHPEYWGGDIPWIAVADVSKRHGRVINDTREHTNQLGIDNSSARLLPAGTVCLARGGTVGYVVILGRPMATSQGFVNWICGPELDNRFLMYLFLREQEALHRFASGATIQTIYYPDVKAFHVCIPPLAEQRRIVGILDEAFAGIATATANAQKNLANARELFDSHLNAVFGRTGQAYSTLRLGDHIELLSGFAFKSSGYTKSEDSVRLLRGDNIIQGELRWEDAKRWRNSDRKAYERYELAAGDVVLAMDRTWVKAGIKYAVLADEDLPCLLVQRVARIRPRTIDRRYLAHAFASRRFTDYVLSIQTGLGVPHISGQQINDFTFQAPDLPAQRTVGEQLDGLREEVDKLEGVYRQKLTALAALKQSLLHRAFRGELAPKAAAAVA